MVDQCGNCDYMRQRQYGDKSVMECRFSAPSTTSRQGQTGAWAEVRVDDWCGDFDPLGWNDPSNLIVSGVTLTTTIKTLVIEAPITGYALWVLDANITNTSPNKGVLVKFFDGDTDIMVGALSVPANQSTAVHPEIRATSGQVWAQLDASDGSDVYVYLQGKQGRPS